MRIQKFDATVTIVCCAMLGFFGWHASEGPRGFSYAGKLEAESGKLQKQLDMVQIQREEIESRVALLRPESIDPDMLDEVARRVLMLSKPNEIVVTLGR